MYKKIVAEFVHRSVKKSLIKMDENDKKINWFRIFSPAVLGIIFSFYAIIYSYAKMESSGGWSYLGIIIFAPIFALLLLLDIMLKVTIKNKTKIIWIVELITLGFIYFFWF